MTTSALRAATDSATRDLILMNADGVLVTDLNGAVLFANAAASTLLRKEGELLVGTEFGHPAIQGELTEIDIPQTSLVAEMRVSEILWQGTPALMATLRDVTAQRRVATALRASEARLRRALENARRSEGERVELIATVAHEVRNPLSAALGLATILADESEGEDAETLRIIRDSIRDADRIIEDLLVLSRFDRGSFEIQTRPVPVRPEVHGVLQSFDTDFRKRVTVFIPSDSAVDADPLRLRQIVRNLVSNAQRYGGEVVSIEVVRRDQDVDLHVVDNGDGVDEETADHLFQNFSRGHAGLGNANSSGLGLAVSRRLARAMGGDLAYSRGDSRTVFTLTLPAA